MKKRLLLMFNPTSGKSQIKPNLWSIIDIFVKGGYDVTVYPTQRRMDAHDTIVERAADFDMVVVCGGDGTLSESVSGLVSLPKEKRTVLGYIPSGSTNDFGSSLEIPFDNNEAAHCIVEGSPMPCDCGMFGEKHFIYIAAFGMFTDVSYETPQRAKNILGHAAYVLEGMKRLKDYSFYHIKVESKELETEDDFIFGFVSNTSSIGGFKNRSEYAPLLNDGLFECVLIKKPNSPADLQRILSALLTSDFDCPELLKFTTDKVRFITTEPVKWTTDGEDGGEHTDITVEVIPEAYNIVVKNHNE